MIDDLDRDLSDVCVVVLSGQGKGDALEAIARGGDADREASSSCGFVQQARQDQAFRPQKGASVRWTWVVAGEVSRYGQRLGCLERDGVGFDRSREGVEQRSEGS